MRKIDIAYFAGVFDGEGCIIIHKSKSKAKSPNYSYVAEVNLANTNEWIVRQFHFSFGGGCYLRKKQGEHTRQIWAWQIGANKAADFLEIILPYLRIKKAQAEIALGFQRHKRHSNPKGGKRVTEKELAIAEATKLLISNLNKGKQPDSEK